MTAPDRVLLLLQTGPQWTRQLQDLTGLDRTAVHGALEDLRGRGYVIENLRREGSHGGGLYRLRDTGRRCSQAGCRVMLAGSNPTPYCRRHLTGRQLDWIIAQLEADVGEGPAPELPGQTVLEVGA